MISDEFRKQVEQLKQISSQKARRIKMGRLQTSRILAEEEFLFLKEVDPGQLLWDYQTYKKAIEEFLKAGERGFDVHFQED